jgi:hypothetical protein
MTGMCLGLWPTNPHCPSLATIVNPPWQGWLLKESLLKIHFRNRIVVMGLLMLGMARSMQEKIDRNKPPGTLKVILFLRSSILCLRLAHRQELSIALWSKTLLWCEYTQMSMLVSCVLQKSTNIVYLLQETSLEGITGREPACTTRCTTTNNSSTCSIQTKQLPNTRHQTCM